jgi:hypothetical protein
MEPPHEIDPDYRYRCAHLPFAGMHHQDPAVCLLHTLGAENLRVPQRSPAVCCAP